MGYHGHSRSLRRGEGSSRLLRIIEEKSTGQQSQLPAQGQDVQDYQGYKAYRDCEDYQDYRDCQD
jgi:hypothetical protein